MSITDTLFKKNAAQGKKIDEKISSTQEEALSYVKNIAKDFRHPIRNNYQRLLDYRKLWTDIRMGEDMETDEKGEWGKQEYEDEVYLYSSGKDDELLEMIAELLRPDELSWYKNKKGERALRLWWD